MEASSGTALSVVPGSLMFAFVPDGFDIRSLTGIDFYLVRYQYDIKMIERRTP